VDRSNSIFVLDSWNHRVSKYDAKGVFQGIIQYGPDVIANDLAVMDGRVFITDLSDLTIKQYDETGAHVLTYQVGQAYSFGGVATQLEGVDIDPTGRVLAQIMPSPGSLYVAPVGTAEQAYPLSEVRQGEAQGMLSRAGAFTGQLIKDSDGAGRYVETVFSDGRTLRANLRAVVGKVVACRFLDFDSSGNAYYLAVVLGADSPIAERVVLKYGTTSALLEVLPVPTVSLTSTRKGVRVSGSGDVYYMYTTRQRVGIVKWRQGGGQ
jgi:hypothetical protein